MLRKYSLITTQKVLESIKKCNTKSKNSKNDISIENLHSHIKCLLRQISENNQANEQNLHGQSNTELDAAITEQEIRKAVFKQKNGKTSGSDDLSSEIIKASYDVISPYIMSLLNNLFDKAEYPESWGL